MAHEILEDGDLFETVYAHKAVGLILEPDSCQVQFLTAELGHDADNFYRVIITKSVLAHLHNLVQGYAEHTGQSVEQLLGID